MLYKKKINRGIFRPYFEAMSFISAPSTIPVISGYFFSLDNKQANKQNKQMQHPSLAFSNLGEEVYWPKKIAVS